MTLPISIRGAKHNNLDHLDLDLPSGKLISLCGPSGSGKSTLAFDTLFAESRRRFLDCLSAHDRQGFKQPDKPEVDSISGLPPALCLEQTPRQQNPNTLLGGLTEILDCLRILYAAVGIPHDPETGVPLERQTPDQIANTLLGYPEGTRLILCSPATSLLSQDVRATLGDFLRQGFLRIFWDGETHDIEELLEFTDVPDDSALVIDRLILRGETSASRLADSIQTALSINEEEVRAVILIPEKEQALQHSFFTRYRNPETGFLLPQLTPRHFSFHSPYGACPTCHGTGFQEDGKSPCPDCAGKRLSRLALAVTIKTGDRELNLPDLTALNLEELAQISRKWELPEYLQPALRPLIDEIRTRTHFLNDLGLSYLTLDRPLGTLSGGELQRARLASQLGGGLSGVLYILDEPSAGLYSGDKERLIRALKMLRDRGNTVLVVEHDEQILRASDYLVDLGPGSGPHGGKVLAQGSPEELMQNPNSPTGLWLAGKKTMPSLPARKAPDKFLQLEHATRFNVRDVTLRFPLSAITCISGPSGSGKSTLVKECLVPALKHDLAKHGKEQDLVTGSEFLNRLVMVDQSLIGKSARSTPATASGLLQLLRPLYAQLPLSRQRGYTAARFSANVRGGRCERCMGTGMIELDMNFLGHTAVVCDACQGQCYNRETLEVTWKGKSIAQSLSLSVDEAYNFFSSLPRITHILRCLQEVGLGYLNLNRRADTLSGGESQRIKIATELAKISPTPASSPKRSLFILDEPTGGLHFNEVALLLNALFRLREAGHTVLCIEHHPDILRAADFLIEMGPGAGYSGGNIVAAHMQASHQTMSES